MTKLKFHNFNQKNKQELYKIIEKQRERTSIFKDMIYIRIIEQNCKKLYEKKLIKGFCHLVIGQEHIYAALKPILNFGINKLTGDKVMSSYRCHGLIYITGSSIKSIIGEMLGKKSGLCSGKGGSMHLYNDTFFGGHGIVGSQVGLSVGIAFAQKFLKQNAKTFCFLGDGAMNQGQVFESMNLAYIYNLPIIFIIENNGFGMWTQKINKDELYKRVPFKSMKISYNFNVMDLVGVFEWSKISLETGPILIEIEVDRLCGHSCKDNIKKEKTNDKFDDFKDLNYLIKTIEDEVEKEIFSLLNQPEK
ncbi:Pyruvate dehydrogenase E1 component subunit alpha, mitochondrial [Cucumispora dikerogammari]|nr:Pyruvate dehydrogenase E1 component subunit alpha, mitochondrial [Cucumispora dikerogammari]